MIPSHADPELFNGSREMVCISASVDDLTAVSASEVIVTANTGDTPARRTTITIQPFARTTESSMPRTSHACSITSKMLSKQSS